jgi:hypothetical protein
MRHWVVLVLFLLALGTLRTVGCGDDPCGDCNDGDPCTIDECSSRRVGEPPGMCQPDERPVEPYCSHRDQPDGTSCGSGNVCVSGVCRENPCAGCVDDGNQCTDYCDYERGVCNVPRRGDPCRGEAHDGRCSGDGVCIVCEELDCDDGDLCTTDQCSEGYGCQHTRGVYCDQCAICDPETGECSDALVEGHLCEADDELGISVDLFRSMYGLCESGRCTGQPCDLTSEEVYRCPIEGHPWASVCCPWEHLPDYPRGYCMRGDTCNEARCLTECPSTDLVYDCVYKAYGDCAVVEYCRTECAPRDYHQCVRQGGVCPSP